MKNFIFLFFISLSIACTSCDVTDTVDEIGDPVDEVTDPVDEVIDPVSDMHGGSPTPVTWDTCGGMIGDHPCDFSLVDQNGDTFQLYDNYGKVILLDFSSIWCGVCNNIAHHAQSFTEEFIDENFLWVTILIDGDTHGVPPTESDISDWCTQHSIEDSPVLLGNRSLIDLTAEAGWPISAWPTLVIINREMIVSHGIHGWSEETIREWLGEGL